MIDIIHKDIAISIKDAVGDICINATPELIGRLVEVLTRNDVLTADDLRAILPLEYYVREDE